jgi:hypothetical protein
MLSTIAGAALAGVAGAGIGMAFPAALSLASPPGASCNCPQMTSGWLLFADSSTRTPDFWREPVVVVEEIAICPHGVRFLFMAEDERVPYLTALVFANPVADKRLYRRRDWSALCAAYSALRAGVVLFAGGELEQGGSLDFRNVSAAARPRILQPCRRLALAWRGKEFPLRGYLDVYMTMLP